MYAAANYPIRVALAPLIAAPGTVVAARLFLFGGSITAAETDFLGRAVFDSSFFGSSLGIYCGCDTDFGYISSSLPAGTIVDATLRFSA